MKARVVHLGDLPLEQVRAHGGEGEIGFCRVLDSSAFEGPWHFVDYAVVPPGASIGRHRHGEDEEMYVVLEGEGMMFLDGEELRVRAGSVVVNRRGGTHGLRNDSARPVRILVVEVGVAGGGASSGTGEGEGRGPGTGTGEKGMEEGAP